MTYALKLPTPIATRVSVLPKRRSSTDYATELSNAMGDVATVEGMAADLGDAIMHTFKRLIDLLLALENDPEFSTNTDLQSIHAECINLNGRVDAIAGKIEQAVLDGEDQF